MVTFIPWSRQTQSQDQDVDPSSSVHVIVPLHNHNQLCQTHTKHICLFKQPQAKDEQGMFKGCWYPRMPTPPLTTDISLLWTLHRPLLLFVEA